jgi:hypothetical protein
VSEYLGRVWKVLAQRMWADGKEQWRYASALRAKCANRLSITAHSLASPPSLIVDIGEYSAAQRLRAAVMLHQVPSAPIKYFLEVYD